MIPPSNRRWSERELVSYAWAIGAGVPVTTALLEVFGVPEPLGGLLWMLSWYAFWRPIQRPWAPYAAPIVRAYVTAFVVAEVVGNITHELIEFARQGLWPDPWLFGQECLGYVLMGGVAWFFLNVVLGGFEAWRT